MRAPLNCIHLFVCVTRCSGNICAVWGVVVVVKSLCFCAKDRQTEVVVCYLISLPSLTRDISREDPEPKQRRVLYEQRARI